MEGKELLSLIGDEQIFFFVLTSESAKLIKLCKSIAVSLRTKFSGV